MPVWWQRIPWVVLGLFVSFAIPASLGLVGATLFLAALVCEFPATVLAYILVFAIMPPKYARQKETVITLFHR
jgi:phage shock protein PspC (stress-responsive transcriptional regulator)